MTVGLYLDDDIGLLGLISQAPRVGLAVIRSDEVGRRGAADYEHLQFASSKGLVLVSCNWRDYLPLHSSYLEKGEKHAGIILVNQWIPKGDRIRLLLFIAKEGTPQEFENSLEWLKDWA